jgi:hypothetical protein
LFAFLRLTRGLIVFENVGFYELVATRTKLLRGILSRYATVEEQELWRSQVEAISAELRRQKELAQ